MLFPEENKIVEIPVQDLAYVGDAVYELYVRQTCLLKFKLKPAELNRIVVKYVNARFQAEAANKIADVLTEEEANILRRGRNANPGTKAKNATIGDYRMASGLETLVGFIYLKQDFARLEELFEEIFAGEFYKV